MVLVQKPRVPVAQLLAGSFCAHVSSVQPGHTLINPVAQQPLNEFPLPWVRGGDGKEGTRPSVCLIPPLLPPRLQLPMGTRIPCTS